MPNKLPLDVCSVDLNQSALVEASAGTGKTWTLTAVVMRLLLDPEYPRSLDTILVVTFTRASTAELKIRIRDRLERLREAVWLQEETTDTLLASVWEKVTASGKDRRWMLDTLEQALARFDEAPIFTIHGFCQRVLEEAAFEAGVIRGIEVVEQWSEWVRPLFLDVLQATLLKESSLPGWVAFVRRQLSGGADELWWSMIRLMEQPECEIDAVDEPASELITIAHQELADAFQNLKAFTEGLQSLVSNYWISKLLLWLALDEVWVIPEGLMDELRKEMAKKRGRVLTESLGETVKTLVEAYDTLELYFTKLWDARCGEVARPLRAKWLEEKARQGWATQHDLLLRVHDALYGAQGERLVERLRERYHAVLIDEFQDTDALQARIFDKAFRAPGRPFLCVGDPKQSIYRFRGADLETYLAVESSLDSHYTLDTNYRSVPALIEAVNAVFKESGIGGVTFGREGIEYRPVKPMPEISEYLLSVEHFSEHENGTLTLHHEAQPPFRFVWCGGDAANERGVARLVANGVQRLLAQKLYVVDKKGNHGKKRLLAIGDIAILVDTRAQAAMMARALTEKRIPCVARENDSVLCSEECISLIRLLRAVEQPNNLETLRAACLTREWGMTLDELAAIDAQPVYWEFLVERLVEWRTIWMHRGVEALWMQWMAEVPVEGMPWPAPFQRLLKTCDHERRITNSLHLAEWCDAHISRSMPLALRLEAFEREHRRAMTDQESVVPDTRRLRLDSDARRVQILTIHGSKGLEFPVVWCPFLWKKRNPPKVQKGGVAIQRVMTNQSGSAIWKVGAEAVEPYSAEQEKEDQQESMRQLYVALTRARHRCYVVWGPGAPTLTKEGRVSQRGGQAHATAMGQRLHALSDDTVVEEALKGRDERDANALFYQGIEAWCRQYPQAMFLEDSTLWAESEAFQFGDGGVVDGKILKPRPFSRKVTSAWRLSSFTGLLRQREWDGDIYFSVQDERVIVSSQDEASRSRTIFSFPGKEVSASVAGNCLHTILECWDKRDRATLPTIVADALQRYGVSIEWTDEIVSWMVQIASTPLTSEGWALKDIQPDMQKAELEFCFAVENWDHFQWIQCLQALSPKMPEHWIAAMQSLKIERLTGFMHGFMDHVFCYQGRFYVLDYKSNYLGDQIEHYEPASLERAMLEHDYILQALIYTVALWRYLESRQLIDASSSENPLGGVIYAFLRGMQGRQGTGVWYYHLPKNWIVELSKCFGT